MGFLKSTGKLLWSATKFTTKAATVTTVAVGKIAGKATTATAKTLYDHREAIGNAAAVTTKVVIKATVATATVVGKSAAYAADKVYDNRDVIAGTGVGIVKGTTNAVGDLSAHVGSEKAITEQMNIIHAQGLRYQRMTQKLTQKLAGNPPKATLLDSLVVGGQTLSDYIRLGTVPQDIQKAYELAYPKEAADHSFIDEIKSMDNTQLTGFVSGIKGKLFEIEYADYLNDGNLPIGYHAELAHSAINPGWDIAILGPDGSMRDTIQLKATDSVSYVQDALNRYPNIDVVTTSEVHSHLVMMGASDHVADSHITDHAITSAVNSGVDQAVGTMHWTPSAVSLALVAFSAYNSEGLSNYQKSKSFGERSVKSYAAYLVGGSVALATGTWWIGMLGGIGSRMILGTGRGKKQKLAQLKDLVVSNELVLRRLNSLY